MELLTYTEKAERYGTDENDPKTAQPNHALKNCVPFSIALNCD